MPGTIRTADAAAAADADDPLRHLRQKFALPAGVVYLDGNSLGALPVASREAIRQAVDDEWGTGLISSWGPTGASNIADGAEDADATMKGDDHTVGSSGWWALPTLLGDRIGTLIGAAPGQTICGDSTSIQLFQTMVAAARLVPTRKKLVIDAVNFPTDTYIAESVARLLGLRLVRVDPRELVPDAETALVAYSQVDYRTGELYDVATITEAVHRAGGVTVWDLCHSAGAMEVGVDTHDVDFAVGCSYKYLNGGPGAPAWAYVAHRHHAKLDAAITGWHGHRDPFGLEPSFTPATGVQRLRIGTPSVLAMQSLRAALTVWDGVSLHDVRSKSLALTDMVIAYADDVLAEVGVEVVTPREHARRGSQVSLRVPNAYAVMTELTRRGVVGDFRGPDLLRLGLTPLTLSYAEVYTALETITQTIAEH